MKRKGKVLMASATFSQHEIQRNFEAAQEASHAGPVFITKDGEPRSVLIDIDEYRRVFGETVPVNVPTRVSLVDLLAVPESEYFDWEPKPLRGRLSRQAD
jgi:hypothetical protein